MQPRNLTWPLGTFSRHLIRTALCILLGLGCILPAYAANDDLKRVFNVPAGPAEQSLKLFSEQSGRGVIFATESLKGVRTNAVQGEFTTRDAIRRMVDGTALTVTQDEKTGAFAVRRDPDPNVERAVPTAPGNRPAGPTPTEARSLQSVAADEAVTLSPFTVNADSDVGYLASNTLAGSRLNTNLKDTAASISVLTEEFIRDIGATNLTEVLEYSNSTQVERDDNRPLGTNPSGNPMIEFYDTYRVRGQSATVARNYFAWKVPSDTYNVERVEDSRGPNSVLFGFGSAGGIVNVSTKQASTARSFLKATAGVASFDSSRGTIDANRVLLDGKLALRLNAVYDQSNSFREYEFSRTRRWNFAAKYQITPTWQVRADYERGFVEANKARDFALVDGGILLWRTAGRPTSATQITDPARSIARLGAARRITFVDNIGVLMDRSATMVTTDTNLAITDRRISDPRINIGGPGQLRQSPSNAISGFVEKRFGWKTFLEFAYNHQDYDYFSWDMADNKIYGDPNQLLKTGVPNPFAGREYVESTVAWSRFHRVERSDTGRATLSTEFDAKKWGNYRVALMGEYENRAFFRSSDREVWAGRPFNAAPENAANQVIRRNYVTEGKWDTYYVPSPNKVGSIRDMLDPVTGLRLSSTWVARSASQDDDPSDQKTGMIAGQARYFSNRIVLAAGFRHDRVYIFDRTAIRHPTTNEWVIDYSQGTDYTFIGRTKTVGVVAHVTPNLSLLFNMASNVGLPNQIIRVVDIDNPTKTVVAPVSEGDGRDMGIGLTLLDGRLYARATYYTTTAKRVTEFGFSGNDTGPARVGTSILDALRSANLITQAQMDAHTQLENNGSSFDRESKGYEVTLTANVTKNWRLQANYSITDVVDANIAPEVGAWIASEYPFYRSFNRTDLVTNRGITIERAMALLQAELDNQRSIEGFGSLGNRRYKVNFYTRYNLPWEKLKEGYVGGGYRHQSKILIGRDAAGGRTYGNSYWLADAMAGYRFRHAPLLKRLNLQLNVTNLFEDTDSLVTRYVANSLTVQRYVVQKPRTWRLTAEFEY